MNTAEWFTTATPEQAQRLAEAWPGVPEDQDEVTAMLLDIAREQVISFAPDDAFERTVVYPFLRADHNKPASRLVYAQLQQAINLWNAGNVSSAGEIGPEGYSFTPRPLDKTIRGIIRPTTGVAHVF